MTRIPLVGFAALGLALVAFVPAASADAAPTVSCGVDLNFWTLDYSCFVNSVGTSGVLVWCPDPLICANGDVLACYVDLTPPWYCQLL
jgi:hypothetical protein